MDGSNRDLLDTVSVGERKLLELVWEAYYCLYETGCGVLEHDNFNTFRNPKNLVS